jgi:hypothetical protein
MTAQERIGLGLLMIARNPAALLFLIPAMFLLLPLAMVFGCVWLLIKLLELVLAKKAASPKQLQEPPIVLPIKENKW